MFYIVDVTLDGGTANARRLTDTIWAASQVEAISEVVCTFLNTLYDDYRPVKYANPRSDSVLPLAIEYEACHLAKDGRRVGDRVSHFLTLLDVDSMANPVGEDQAMRSLNAPELPLVF